VPQHDGLPLDDGQRCEDAYNGGTLPLTGIGWDVRCMATALQPGRRALLPDDVPGTDDDFAAE